MSGFYKVRGCDKIGEFAWFFGYYSGVNGFIFESGGVASFPNGMSCDCVYEYELVCEGRSIVGEIDFDAEFMGWR